jgi:hypothetical protein
MALTAGAKQTAATEVNVVINCLEELKQRVKAA